MVFLRGKPFFALSTAFILSVSMTTPVVHAAKSTQALVSESINLVGKTYLDLDAKGKDLEKDNYEETTISVKDFTVKDKLIRLKGEVTYNDKSIPFDFEGELLKGRKSDNVLIGKLEDRDENFDCNSLLNR